MRRTLIWWLLLGILSLSGCQPSGNEQQKILFMSWDENQFLQLFSFELTTQDTQQLTEHGNGLSEYQLSPNHEYVVFVSTNVDQTSEIWLLTLNGRNQFISPQLVHTCKQSNCAQLQWAPDSRRLIYEQREVNENQLGQPTLWWLDTETMETIEALPELDYPALAASISPDGQWLTYSVPAEERVYGYHFENGRFITIQSALGHPATWHPTQESFLVNDLNITVLHEEEGEDHQEHEHDFVESIHLFSIDTLSQTRTALTKAGQVDDAFPRYSPDGEWIVFGRKLIRTNSGRQLWLMRADGTEKQALTDQINIHHSVVSWSENGRFLLYQTIDLHDGSQAPLIWMMEVETGETTRIIENGIQGSWID